jgi:signal peptidase I
MSFLNRGRAALGYFFAYVILIATAFALMPQSHPPSQRITRVQIASWIISICAIIHAIVIAKRRDHAEPLRWYSRRWYLLALIYPGLIFILLGIRAYLYQPFNSPSASMEPTVNLGDYFLASKLAYDFSSPERGDVVVFYAPQFHSYFVKRVVGLPGDRVQMTGGRLFLDGVRVPTHPLADFYEACDSGSACRIPRYEEVYPDGKVGQTLDRFPNGPEDDTDVVTVPTDSYFVLGDNRDNSNDSRSGLGFVPRKTIIGRAAYKFIADGHWT